MEDIRIFALGGLDEDGKNMYCIEINKDIFVIECGIKYPSQKTQLGVDYVIPDFSYIIQNQDRVKAIFITHAHDDVMLALPSLLKVANFDVYASALTAKMLEAEFVKAGIKNKRVNVISRKSTTTIAGRKIRTFPVMQSIADGIGIAIETSQGQIVYTSEYIFDYDTTKPGFFIDVNELADIGKNGVFALLSESVASTRTGFTSPRHKITDYIKPVIETAKGRIVFSLYKQNLYRIIEILDLAVKNKKKVFFRNDSNLRILKIVESLGYYNFPRSLLVTKEEFTNDIEDIIIIVSGEGKNVFRILNNIAVGGDKRVLFRDTDTVYICSPVVPGTEKMASLMENNLYRCGCTIKKLNAKDVLSMHASIEDIKMMIYMLKPEYFIPVKGQYRMLLENANLAVQMNYRPDKVVILDNGQVAEFVDGKLKSTKQVFELHDILVDGDNQIGADSMVIADRNTLSTDGIIVVGVVLNFKTKELIGGPDVQSRGVIYLKDADYILENVSKILIETINEAACSKNYDNMQVRADARDRIGAYLLRETGKRPMIMPAIVEINV